MNEETTTTAPARFGWLWQADRADMREELVTAHRRFVEKFRTFPAAIYHSAADSAEPIHAGAIVSAPSEKVHRRCLLFAVPASATDELGYLVEH